MLDKLQLLVNELKTTNSSNAKKEILTRYDDEDVKELLEYTYNTQKKFNVKSANLKKRKDLIEETDLDIIELLDALYKREITGHKALSVTNGFIEQNKEYEELIYTIIDKNLKTRTDAKLINKVFKDLIPMFEVALADEYEKKKKHVDFSTQKFYASCKLDGCRCLILKTLGGIKAYSRQGIKFLTLGNVLDDFRHEFMPWGVYDGEICIIGDDGREQYKGIMKEIRKKDHTIDNAVFKVFDHIEYEEFLNQKSDIPFSKRYELLQEIFKTVPTKHVDVVEQIEIRDDAHFEELKQVAQDKGWEGLIIREDLGYEGKRSRHMLKVKAFFDAEFTVLGTYATKKRMLVNGREEELDCMGGVNIEYKGYNVDVGSGWSDAERLEFHSNPENIIGKVITVQWQEETDNDKGEKSLRFPTKKWIHGEERNT